MIPNVATFIGNRLSAKCEADPDFRNSQVMVAALRFINLAYLSGLVQGLIPARYGFSEEMFRDLQTGSHEQGVYQKAFNATHLLECFCHLHDLDRVRVEITLMNQDCAKLFSWTAIFEPDGTGEIIGSQTFPALRSLPQQHKVA